MEDKKVKAGSVAVGICLFIIAVLLVVIVLMYYNAKNEKNEKDALEAKVSELNATIKEKDAQVDEIESKISKIEDVLGTDEKKVEETKTENNNTEKDKKSLVSDAKYSYKNYSDESYYSENMKKSYSLADIKLPYINIKSEDATKANKEIKDLFDKLAKAFEEEYKNYKTWYNIASYKIYSNGNILSILITTESGGTDVEANEYYTYNFNLDTLKLCEYKDIYEYAGFKSDDINSKVEKAIKDNERFIDFDEDLSEYVTKSIKNYTNSTKNNSIKYFLDENGKLNVIVKIEIPAGRGEFNTIIKVD